MNDMFDNTLMMSVPSITDQSPDLTSVQISDGNERVEIKILHFSNERAQDNLIDTCAYSKIKVHLR